MLNGPSPLHNQRSGEVSFSQSPSIKDGDFSAMNALVINDRWLRGVEIPLRFAFRLSGEVTLTPLYRNTTSEVRLSPPSGDILL
jgi:hypothetical protein